MTQTKIAQSEDETKLLAVGEVDSLPFVGMSLTYPELESVLVLVFF